MTSTLLRSSKLAAPVRDPVIRFFSVSPITAAKEPVKKVDKQKQRLKQEQAAKKRARQDPSTSPLYLEIPLAMRFLRAAEVGQPVNKTTVLVQLSVIPTRGSKPLAGSIRFPKPLRSNQVVVFTMDESVAAQAREMGAMKVGGVDLVQEISNGSFKLDSVTHAFATPDMTKELRAIARQLGPKGLMPSTKKGTIAQNITQLIDDAAGTQPFKQKGPNLAIPIGRCDFSDRDIIANLTAVSNAIHECQAQDQKRPNLITKTVLLSTLGPALVVNIKRA